MLATGCKGMCGEGECGVNGRGRPIDSGQDAVEGLDTPGSLNERLRGSRSPSRRPSLNIVTLVLITIHSTAIQGRYS